MTEKERCLVLRALHLLDWLLNVVEREPSQCAEDKQPDQRKSDLLTLAFQVPTPARAPAHTLRAYADG